MEGRLQRARLIQLPPDGLDAVSAVPEILPRTRWRSASRSSSSWPA